MQSAFLPHLLLPPPAARPRIVADGHRTRARRAADAGIATVVERVVRNVVLRQVVPDVVMRPPRKWREFSQSMDLVVAFGQNVATIDGLLATQSGEPGALAGESAAERFDLAHAAARLADLDAAVETVDPGRSTSAWTAARSGK